MAILKLFMFYILIIILTWDLGNKLWFCASSWQLVNCADWFSAAWYKARHVWEERMSTEELLPQTGLWASLWNFFWFMIQLTVNSVPWEGGPRVYKRADSARHEQARKWVAFLTASATVSALASLNVLWPKICKSNKLFSPSFFSWYFIPTIESKFGGSH